jgi:hypothetical protein
MFGRFASSAVFAAGAIVAGAVALGFALGFANFAGFD